MFSQIFYDCYSIRCDAFFCFVFRFLSVRMVFGKRKKDPKTRASVFIHLLENCLTYIFFPFSVLFFFSLTPFNEMIVFNAKQDQEMQASPEKLYNLTLSFYNFLFL